MDAQRHFLDRLLVMPKMRDMLLDAAMNPDQPVSPQLRVSWQVPTKKRRRLVQARDYNYAPSMKIYLIHVVQPDVRLTS